MKISRIFTVVVMLMVASLTIVSAQDKPRDLQTELKKFWPAVDDYNKNVWQLYPVDMSEIDVYWDGIPIIKAPIGNRLEEFSIRSIPAQFDSDFYKLNFDKSLPTVKGTILSLDAKYDPSSVYIGIIYDNRILENNKARPDSKDNFDQPFHKVSQADFEKVNNSQGMEGRGTYDTGIPIIQYGENNANDVVVSPSMVVKIFKIGHPVGDFMESHRGQKLEKVRLGVLDKSQPAVAPCVEDFANDYLFPFGISFVFSDKSKEGYFMFKLSSGEYELVLKSFVTDWRP